VPHGTPIERVRRIADGDEPCVIPPKVLPWDAQTVRGARVERAADPKPIRSVIRPGRTGLSGCCSNRCGFARDAEGGRYGAAPPAGARGGARATTSSVRGRRGVSRLFQRRESGRAKGQHDARCSSCKRALARLRAEAGVSQHLRYPRQAKQRELCRLGRAEPRTER
jgi:hypothetical protein